MILNHNSEVLTPEEYYKFLDNLKGRHEVYLKATSAFAFVASGTYRVSYVNDELITVSIPKKKGLHFDIKTGKHSCKGFPEYEIYPSESIYLAVMKENKCIIELTHSIKKELDSLNLTDKRAVANFIKTLRK